MDHIQFSSSSSSSYLLCALTRGADEKVLRLDVAVHDVLLVAERHRLDQLADVLPDLRTPTPWYENRAGEPCGHGRARQVGDYSAPASAIGGNIGMGFQPPGFPGR